MIPFKLSRQVCLYAHCARSKAEATFDVGACLFRFPIRLCRMLTIAAPRQHH
jgi:hypothetical protein